MSRRSGLNRRQMLGGGAGLTGLALVGTPAGVPRAAALDGPAGASTARIAGHLSRYAGFGNKRSGGAGELAAADWIADAVRNAGFAVEQEDFDVPHFAPDTARIAAADARIEVLPQPVVVPTGPGGIRAEGVLVRDRHEAPRAHGRIAFLVLPHARHAAIFGPAVLELLEPVLAAGPLAVVVVPTGPTGLIVGLNARLGPIAPVPVAVMAPRDLDPISAAVATGQPLTLTIAGTAGTLRSRNLIARRAAGPRWLAFSTPRSGWFDCVGERGPGTAIFLELCAWAARRFPDRSLFAINTGGHELDFAGTHLAMAHAPPPERTDIWTHLGAGLATRDERTMGARALGLLPTADPARALMATETLLADAGRAFAGISGFECPVPVVAGAGELSSIVEKGFTRALAGLGVHRWCHTPEDTLDKVDAALVAPVLAAHMAVIEQAVAAAGAS